MNNKDLYTKYEQSIESVARYVAANYQVPGLDRDDIMQEVRIHCFKCVHKFNPAIQNFPISFFSVVGIYSILNIRTLAMAKKRYNKNDIHWTALGELEYLGEPASRVKPPEIYEPVEIDYLLGIDCKALLSKYEYEVLVKYVNGGYISQNKQMDNARVRLMVKIRAAVKLQKITATSHLD